MIPDNKNKRFSLGYFCRETLDLFHQGWTTATREIREYHRLDEAKQSRKYMQELLEEALYDKASRGNTAEVIEALKYYQRKKEFDQRADLRPYTWGEQIMSFGNAGLNILLVAGLFTFSANWVCGGSRSQACVNIRANTASMIQHFSEPKN